MPTKSERRKARAFRRTTKETRMITVDEKHSKHRCALCQNTLSGVPHGKNVAQRKKLSKTQRRPTGMLGGILCGSCRSLIVSETAKVKAEIKQTSEVDLRYQPYITQIEKRVN